MSFEMRAIVSGCVGVFLAAACGGSVETSAPNTTQAAGAGNRGDDTGFGTVSEGGGVYVGPTTGPVGATSGASGSLNTAGSSSVAGSAGVGDDSAGASGAANCQSDVMPAYATITADLPIPFADAKDATFTACRGNAGDCVTGTGGHHDYATWWVATHAGAPTFLTFDDSTITPSVTLKWDIDFPDAPLTTDEYHLTVRRGNDEPLVVFDTTVSYTFQLVSRDLVGSEFCSKIFVASVDLRAGK